jgi:gamma-glutamyltranspeptidase/glutathione hydrolase
MNFGLSDWLHIEMGHDIRVVKGFHRGMMGRGQVIQKLQDGSGKFVWAAGSDPRADGHAAAQI